MARVDTKLYWRDTAPFGEWPALDRNLDVDVVVIGAGITGLTTAWLLKRSGVSVAVIDRGAVGGVDSMSTTAHVTHVTDQTLTELVRVLGRDHARAVWDAGQAAIDQIEAIVDAEGIDCDWQRVTGYRHAPVVEGEAPAPVDVKRHVDHFRQEVEAATSMGFDAAFIDRVPLMGTPGVAFGEQALFHPGKYLAALARRIAGGGSHVFERTASTEITDDPLTVHTRHHTLTCRDVVVATHTPLMGKTGMASAMALQTKLYLYTSYAIAGFVPAGSVPHGAFWDTNDPYRYLRIDAGGARDRLVYGGEDHKTGQDDPAGRFERLEASLRALVPGVEITHRWSGQVVETNDGLPYMGETSPHQFAGTGYGGNGMTFGTLAAMMAADSVAGRPNPWSALFDVGRTRVRGGVWDYLKENFDYPYYMVRDRLTGAQISSLRSVPPDEGRIVDLNGDLVAAYRGPRGALTLLSPVCTHMGCRVEWNGVEKTWDCPCHGSRFKARGEVLAGPAETPLAPYTRE